VNFSHKFYLLKRKDCGFIRRANKIYPDMIIVSRTPVRISFFGGGTDYPNYFLKMGGRVVGACIDKYTHISISTPQPFFDHKYRIAYSQTELTSSIDAIQHPSIRECLKLKDINRHLDVHIFSDLPARTGLGSSSSFTVGFLNALYALEGKRVTRQSLAEEACFIEQSMIRENVGSQDQFHAAFGGMNIFSFSERGTTAQPLLISRTKRVLLEDSLMLFYTGITRHASEILHEQMEKTDTKQNDQYLKRMQEMVEEFELLVSSSDGDRLLSKFGSMLDEGWNLKKQLSSKISKEDIDGAYSKAKEAGALGGKLCGAGGGGFLLLLVPEKDQAAVRSSLHPMIEVPFHFEDEGSKIIYMKE